MGESMLSKMKLHYEYLEDELDIMAILKSLRIRRALKRRK